MLLVAAGHTSVAAIVVLCVLAAVLLWLKFAKPWKRK